MIKATSSMLILMIVIAVLGTPLFSEGAAVAVNHPEGFLYAEGDQLMLNESPFLMKGFNYYPRDYGWTSMVDWDWDAVDRDFALAASLNANTIRTGTNFQYATGNINAQKNIYTTYHILPEYLDAIDRLLSIAEKHQLKVVLWLNDGLYWELWNPAHFDVVRKHLEELIPRYANDPRIAAWDLATDLDGSMLLPPPVGAYGLTPWSDKDGMLTFLRNMADTIRELDPNHPLAVGFCWASSALLVQDFTDFLFPQFLGGDYPNIVTEPTAGPFDDYGQWWEVLNDKEAVIDRLEAKVRSLQDQLVKPMPIVLSEYGIYTASPDGSFELQQGVYEAILEMAFLRMDLAGALNWALTDFIWPPKTFTIVPRDAPMATSAEQTFGVFTLDYTPKPAAEVAQIYYADRPEIVFQTTPMELQFVFSKSFVPSDDNRELSVAFDSIKFRDVNNRTLVELDIGKAETRPYLESGFFEDEGPWGNEVLNFAWAGGSDKSATVEMPFPEGTENIVIHAHNNLTGMVMDVLVDGEEQTHISMKTGWRDYLISLPSAEPLSIGDTHTIRGHFNLPISSGTVTLQMSYDMSSWNDVATTVPAIGKFSAPIHFDHGGQVLVRAVWSGGGYYLPSTSDPLIFDIPRESSLISLSVSPNSSMLDSEIVITGRLEPQLSGMEITLTLTKPDASRITNTVTSTVDGDFSLNYRPDQSGSWSVQAGWNGNLDYDPTETSTTFVVTKIASVLSCSLAKEVVALGDVVNISGALSPVFEDTSVQLLFSTPDGSSYVEKVSIGAQGSYSYTFQPQEIGEWMVMASWEGIEGYTGSESSAMAFTITEKRYGLYIGVAIAVVLLVGLTSYYIFILRQKKTKHT